MNFFHTHIGENAVARAVQTLRSGFVSEGRLVREFEQELSQAFGMTQPVAVNSGTSALHLALSVVGVGPGDEVVLPPQTFVATGMAIVMCGATPVFADIDPKTGNLFPPSIAAHVTEHTKAIMPVHWGGYPCSMDEIGAIAQTYDLAVIEDAAHALGATYKGRPVGSLSRFTAFSFQAIKHLTTGDGGALCCLQEDDFHQARRRRWFGIDRERDQASLLGERVYNLDNVGFKYHLNDLGAALGLGNLADMPVNLARSREIGKAYLKELQNVPGVNHLERKSDRESSWWIFPMLVERREDFIRSLKSRGVPTSVVHQRIDRHRVFGGQRNDLPGQDFFNQHQVALPIHSGLTDADVDRVIQGIRAGW